MGSKGLPRLDVMTLDVDRLEYDISDPSTQLSAIQHIEYTPEAATVSRRRINKTVQDVNRKNSEHIVNLFTRDNPILPS